MVSESTATDVAPARAPSGRSPSCRWLVKAAQLLSECSARSPGAEPEARRAEPQRDRAKAGAQERTRTSTAVKPLAPEASASTNSATWAPPCSEGGTLKAPTWQRQSERSSRARRAR